MRTWPGPCLLAACLLGFAPARGDAPDAAASAPASPDSGIAYGAAAPRYSAYREHAPLAWFGLGALAVGGVFYGIQAGMSGPRVGYVAGDRSQMDLAVGAAGLTAVASAAAFFYFAHRSQSAWDARLAGGLDGQGRVNVAAALVLPLPGP